MQLTNDNTRKLRPGDTLNCTQVPGLQLRAFPNRMSYYLYYRTRGGKQRRPKLCDHGTMSLADVRKLAKTWLAEVAGGGDPSQRFEAERTAPRLSDLIAQFRRDRLPRLKPNTQHDYAYVFDRRLLPACGEVPVAEFNYQLAQKLHAQIPGKAHANKVLRVLSLLLTFAETLGWREVRSNPCSTVRMHREVKRKRYASREELAGILAEVHRYLADGELWEQWSAVFILLSIHTGARPNELGTAPPSALQRIDLPEVRYRIVLTEHKTDRTLEERKLYVPNWLADAILALPARPGQDTLLGLRTPRLLWERIRAKVGCVDLRYYDLRHTFASIGLSSGLHLDQIGELLGHKQKQTTSRYVHLEEDTGQGWASRVWDRMGR